MPEENSKTPDETKSLSRREVEPVIENMRFLGRKPPSFEPQIKKTSLAIRRYKLLITANPKHARIENKKYQIDSTEIEITQGLSSEMQVAHLDAERWAGETEEEAFFNAQQKEIIELLINQFWGLEIDSIAQLTGKSEEEVITLIKEIDEIAAKGLFFRISTRNELAIITTPTAKIQIPCLDKSRNRKHSKANSKTPREAAFDSLTKQETPTTDHIPEEFPIPIDTPPDQLSHDQRRYLSFKLQSLTPEEKSARLKRLSRLGWTNGFGARLIYYLQEHEGARLSEIEELYKQNGGKSKNTMVTIRALMKSSSTSQEIFILDPKSEDPFIGIRNAKAFKEKSPFYKDIPVQHEAARNFKSRLSIEASEFLEKIVHKYYGVLIPDTEENQKLIEEINALIAAIGLTIYFRNGVALLNILTTEEDQKIPLLNPACKIPEKEEFASPYDTPLPHGKPIPPTSPVDKLTLEQKRYLIFKFQALTPAEQAREIKAIEGKSHTLTYVLFKHLQGKEGDTEENLISLYKKGGGTSQSPIGTIKTAIGNSYMSGKPTQAQVLEGTNFIGIKPGTLLNEEDKLPRELYEGHADAEQLIRTSNLPQKAKKLFESLVYQYYGVSIPQSSENTEVSRLIEKLNRDLAPLEMEIHSRNGILILHPIETRKNFLRLKIPNPKSPISFSKKPRLARKTELEEGLKHVPERSQTTLKWLKGMIDNPKGTLAEWGRLTRKQQGTAAKSIQQALKSNPIIDVKSVDEMRWYGLAFTKRLPKHKPTPPPKPTPPSPAKPTQRRRGPAIAIDHDAIAKSSRSSRPTLPRTTRPSTESRPELENRVLQLEDEVRALRGMLEKVLQNTTGQEETPPLESIQDIETLSQIMKGLVKTHLNFDAKDVATRSEYPTPFPKVKQLRTVITELGKFQKSEMPQKVRKTHEAILGNLKLIIDVWDGDDEKRISRKQVQTIARMSVEI